MKRFLENTEDKIWLGKEDAGRNTAREERSGVVIDLVDRLELSGEGSKGQVGK
jgi:hypothetical protein